MSFTEAKLESAIIELFQNEGYEYVHGDNVARQENDVLLRDDLQAFLSHRYKSAGITANEVQTAVHVLEQSVSASLYEDNVHTLRLLMDGFSIKREDSCKPNLFINPIDYSNPDNNIFKIVNQFEIQGEEKRIPDAVVFVNGIPVVVLEFKSAVKEETTILDAYKQLTIRYRRDIPLLFKYNAFVVISDGVNNKFGSLFTGYDFFYAWRKVEQHDKSTDGINSLYTMVRGLFRKDRLLEVIHNFIFLPDTPKGETKIVCRYPQYFAATALLHNILQHTHLNDDGDGKGGTYFGATGCGKSFTMLFLARMLMKSRELHSPTILFITDRTDLDDQLSKQVLNARKFIGDETIRQVESRTQLGELLRGRTSGGVFLTTIQKFSEDIDLLSERANIICISDEAHRSQTGIGMKLRITDDGVYQQYGFAKYLRDSLPNATYVGFTGTPIDATLDVFGSVVDSYTMTESVSDGITRKIVYEGRASKVILDTQEVEEIEKYYSMCAAEGSAEYQIEESKRAMTRLDVILTDPDLLMRIAEDIVRHYERRVEEGSTVKGKAMIVCSSRQIAYYLYQNIIKLRPEWAEVKECCEGEELSEEEKKNVLPIERVKMVITRNKDDEKELYDLLGNNDYRKQLDEQFKEDKSNFKIAIVVDMWITGFDVPALDTMYCFKPLQRHTLIQTISRVNRVYPGKDKGLVVDYLGIKNNLNFALKQYGGGELSQASIETIEQSVVLTKDELDIIRRMFHKFDYSGFYLGSPIEQLDILNRAAEYIQRTKETEVQFMGHSQKMRSAFNICCNTDKFGYCDVKDIHFFIAVRSVIHKLTRGTAADSATMNHHVAELIRNALISEEVEEITQIGAKEDEIDLLSEQYMERLNRLKLPNTKVKLMESLLRKVIGNLQKINKAKGIDFSERLEAIVRNYNDRSDNTTLANEVIDEVVSQMTDLLTEINNDKKQSVAMGISYEEKSFFDILMLVAKKYNFEYPEDKAIELSKKIKVIVDDKAKYTDWSRREDIKAELKMNLILTLSEYGYPPFVNDEVFKEILEQAENFKKNRV